jgi:hypothetical protein
MTRPSPSTAKRTNAGLIRTIAYFETALTRHKAAGTT